MKLEGTATGTRGREGASLSDGDIEWRYGDNSGIFNEITGDLMGYKWGYSWIMGIVPILPSTKETV